MASAISVTLLGVATVFFIGIQRHIREIERLIAVSGVVSDAVYWSLGRQFDHARYPFGPSVRQIGLASLDYQAEALPAVGRWQYYRAEVIDYRNGGNNVVTLTIPVTGD
jgi:hypothetical protein